MSATSDPASNTLTEVNAASRARVSWTSLYSFPWWLLLLILLGIWVIVLIVSNQFYNNTFRQLYDGIGMTLRVSGSAYAIAIVLGLIIGLIRANPPKAPNHGSTAVRWVFSILQLVIYQLVTFYVAVLRGLPILVVLLIINFVVATPVIEFLNSIGFSIPIRGGSPVPAIIALGMAYGAFVSETFRAGIQSIEKGQHEAAKSLGMNYFQVMWHVVLPQAVRRILPPLGNDLIAMIKDSSLVTILGINDITQLAKLWSSSTFRYMETYFVVAVIYLTMTVLGSLLVRFIEDRMRLTEN